MTPTDLVLHREERALSTELVEQASLFALGSISKNTRKAYENAWEAFKAWCLESGRVARPAHPDTICGYLAHLAKRPKQKGTGLLSLSTIQLALAAICYAHTTDNHPSPLQHALVKHTLAGLVRNRTVAQKGKAPLLDSQIALVLEKLPAGLLGVRDRALLTLGFAGAFRRSELVGLDVGDLKFVDDGIIVSLRRSKTNQRGEEELVGVPFGSKVSQCPVRSVQAWLEAACIEEGAVFRPVTKHGKLGTTRLDGADVSRAVKKYASKALGIKASELGGHSLRAGFVTSAFEAGHGAYDVASQTRHKSMNVLRKYDRRANLFKRNVAKGLL